MHFNIIDTQRALHLCWPGRGPVQDTLISSAQRKGTLRTLLLPLLTPTPFLCCSTATKIALPAILIPGVSWAEVKCVQ
jgi:hypothetical protein